MGSLILGVVIGASLVALLVPWVGIINGYACILLGPQVLWWWAFEGVRHFLIIAACTFLGCVGAFLQGRIDFRWLHSKQNFYLFLWFLFIIVSYFFGTYVNGGPGPRYFPPGYILNIVCNSFFFYFLATICITDDKKFRYLCAALIVTCVYYVYWTNNLYLTGHYGRLGGPRSINADQYGDQNNLAMFLVISLPFLYYLGCAFRNRLYRYATWLIIPFGWHAVFLTGSRGGLIGLGITTLIMVFRSSNRRLGFLLIPMLVVAFVWQGGPVMTERALTIQGENGGFEESAQGRLDSWAAATKMILKHPLTGVGIASFGVAFPDFSDKDPKEAHNTYFQIGAESGAFALLGYIAFMITTILGLWRKKKPDISFAADKNDPNATFIWCMHNAVLSAWVGFALCALFLSLQVFEQFFYLAVLSNFLLTREKITGLLAEDIDNVKK